LTKTAFKVLYDKYFDLLRNYVFYRCGNQEMATDIAQETFLKIWQKQLFPDPGKEKALLFKMATDMYISQFRRQKLDQKYVKQVKSGDNTAPSPHDEMQFTETQNKYNKVISDLSENLRTTYLMNRIDGLTYAEIATNLGLSVKAIEKRMSTILNVLRKELL